MQPTRTKIVATLGPATDREEAIRPLVRAGVDVFRLNFSHGDHTSHGELIDTIRRVARDSDEPVAILQDLQGPRIRTGALKGREGVMLEEGAQVVLRCGDFEGDARTVPVQYEHLADDVRPGDHVMLRDGTIELEVAQVCGRDVRCRVVSGGELQEHQGINLPGVRLSLSAPTEKDIDDLHFGMERGVDYVALSFVQSGEDVQRLKAAMREHAGEGAELPVIAKIEKPEAVDNLRGILLAADGVMVARGDLGIEMPAEAVPVAQKKIIRMANALGKPVITATQMLESMVDAPRPTRAEASDVANAILDGTDAVMLSGETSVGNYPVQSVRTMDRIAREIEHYLRQQGSQRPPEIEEVHNRVEHALANAACSIAERLHAAGIVSFTITGSTARYVSQRRPSTCILALTPEETTYRRMALLWGVHPVRLSVFDTTDEMIEQGARRLLECGLVAHGDTVVYVAGASTRTAGGTDMLKIHRIEEE